MSDARTSSVTFFFPYRDVSGVPVVFARMAAHLASVHGVPIRVIDYADGYMARTLRDTAGVTIEVFQDAIPFAVRHGTVLVMQGAVPSTIRSELRIDPNTRIFFWTLHPLNWIQTLLPTPWGRDQQARHPNGNLWAMSLLLPGLRRRMATLLRALADSGALAFMDGSTFDSTCQRLGVTLPTPTYLPVPVDVPPTYTVRRPLAAGAPVDVVWLGRLADFKVHVLIHTIERLARVATVDAPVELTVIGDGPLAGAVDIAVTRHAHGAFVVHRVGTLEGDALAVRLRAADLLIAMGASALEGARFGVPTLLADPAYGPIARDYRFDWLADADRYSLGRLVTDASYETGNASLEHALALVRRDPDTPGRRTHEYCRSHFDLTVVAGDFLDMTSRSTFTFGRVDRTLLRKAFVRRIYERARAARVARNASPVANRKML